MNNPTNTAIDTAIETGDIGAAIIHTSSLKAEFKLIMNAAHNAGYDCREIQYFYHEGEQRKMVAGIAIINQKGVLEFAEKAQEEHAFEYFLISQKNNTIMRQNSKDDYKIIARANVSGSDIDTHDSDKPLIEYIHSGIIIELLPLDYSKPMDKK